MTVLKEVIARYETDGRIVKCFDICELIRCKDCIHYRGHRNYCENDMFAIESGFCNWAEKKE